MPNAQVALETADGLGVPRLTDAQGRARVVVGGAAGRVRVRQIGYRPASPSIGAEPGRAELVVRLTRVPLVLARHRVAGQSSCLAFADSAEREAAAALYTRLREAAEQYDAFRRAYPFEARVEHRITSPRADSGRVPRVRVSAERYWSDRWAGDYQPGDVLRWDAGSFRANLLFVTTLTDPRFWRSHCFAAGGTTTVGGRTAIQVTFAPTPETRGPDWSGAALLDTATSQLLRVDFRLERGGRSAPKRLEGYTTFMTPSPFVAVPESTYAVWWERGPGDDGAWGLPDAAQVRLVRHLVYRRPPPPPVLAPSPGPPSTVLPTP